MKALKNYLAAIFFAIVGWFIPVPAHAASYAVNGSCFSDSTSILQEFVTQFPRIDSAGITNVINTTINSTGLLTYQIQFRSLNSAAFSTNLASSLQLPVCDSAIVGSNSEYKVITSLGIVFLFILGLNFGRNFSMRAYS